MRPRGRGARPSPGMLPPGSAVPSRLASQPERRPLTHLETDHLGFARSRHGLDISEIRYPRRVFWNLSSAAPGRRIAEHDVRCHLVNAGWSGGPYGVSKRMPLALTRQMVRAALDGGIERAGFTPEPVFGLDIRRACPGVPSRVLDPRRTWADGAACDRQARALRDMFDENTKRLGEESSPQAAGVTLA